MQGFSLVVTHTSTEKQRRNSQRVFRHGGFGNFKFLELQNVTLKIVQFQILKFETAKTSKLFDGQVFVVPGGNY